MLFDMLPALAFTPFIAKVNTRPSVESAVEKFTVKPSASIETQEAFLVTASELFNTRMPASVCCARCTSVEKSPSMLRTAFAHSLPFASIAPRAKAAFFADSGGVPASPLA
ncbi:MAG: hypothetical protein AB7V27_01525 [Candidatus Binatia bacterium]